VEKGTRVKVVKGKQSVGVEGVVFWTGPDRYKENALRLGVRSDDGETIWVSTEVVEVVGGGGATSPAPVPAGPPPKKGDRVKWRNKGAEGLGTVFWVGPSKSGPGFRVGVNADGQEEALWLDAAQIQSAEGAPAAPPRPSRPAPSKASRVEDDDAAPEAWDDGGAPASAPPPDDGPSWSDADIPWSDAEEE
jgi:hypothetical protein